MRKGFLLQEEMRKRLFQSHMSKFVRELIYSIWVRQDVNRVIFIRNRIDNKVSFL
jgi:hypothetical protein